MSEVKEHSVIYLAPACHEQHMQREWCEDDVWHACEECGSGDASVRYNLGTDFDRVTAERDAALADLASSSSDKEAYAQNAIDLRKRVDALQQRLTAADERVDVLEGLLNLVQGHIGDASLSRDIDVALKSAEGGGDD